MRYLLLAVALLSTGCLRKTEFKCQMDDQCSTGGACEMTGYCSFADSECPGGRRYGELSGDLGGQCVGGLAGVDGGVDGMIDAPSVGCPPTYRMVAGAGTHVYRVLATSAPWATQQTACAADGANAYLTVPSDQAELTALLAVGTAARVWVGIDDQNAEGTYVTTRAGTFAANDPLWDVNEPNNTPLNGPNGPNAESDCTVGLKASNQLADTRCGDPYPAICECDP